MTRARKILNDVQEDEGATQAAPGGTVAALGTIPIQALEARARLVWFVSFALSSAG